MTTNNLEQVLQTFITTTNEALLRLERQNEAFNQRYEADLQRRAEEEKQRRAEEEQRRAEEEAERKRELRAWNKQRGELANQLGRVVEDIVAPNIPRIGEEYFGYTDLIDFSVRRKVYYQGRRDMPKEFDTLAVYSQAVIFNETKERARQKDLEEFVTFLESGRFYDYFPEYRERRLIPILSSLYLDEAAVNYLTKHRIYALAMGEETMELLNFDRLHANEQNSVD